MSDKIPRHIQIAYQFGLMHQGWNIKDYVVHAALTRDGYEVIVVDGVQRSGKSNLSLQISSWAKESTQALKLNKVELKDYLKAINSGTYPSDYIANLPVQPEPKDVWTRVLEDISFKAGEFVSTLKKVPDKQPKDSQLWDDIAGHYTNMSFRIDPEAYAQVDSAFTVIGTKAKIIITNIPNITRLSKNIKDHLSIEIFVGRNKLRKMMRVFRLPGLRHVDMNLFKADVEAPSRFDIYKIPPWAWRQYEDRRIELAKDVFETLGETVGMDHAPEGYMSIPDAINKAVDLGVNWGASTIQQGASRGLWKKVKVDGYLFIEDDSFTQVLEAETRRLE